MGVCGIFKLRLSCDDDDEPDLFITLSSTSTGLYHYHIRLSPIFEQEVTCMLEEVEVIGATPRA